MDANEQAAVEIVNAVLHLRTTVEVKINVGEWTNKQIKKFLDQVVESANSKSPIRVKGLRMTSNILSGIGVEGDPLRGANYREIPVVAAAADFDTLELILTPRKGA